MKRRAFSTLMFLAAAVLLFPTCGLRALLRGDLREEGLYYGKLSNGLTVLLKEDHSSRVTAVNVYVRAGSRNEPERIGGISHLIEHLIFKGTEQRPVGAIAREIEARGGEINAYTTQDETVYWAVVPSTETNTAADVLLDGVFNARFDPDEVEKEREVVLEELRRSLDSPPRRLYDLLSRTAYALHPYARPVLGRQESLESITREDLLAYHKKWYVPGNVIVVAVGDFRTSDVRAAIRESTKAVRKSTPHRPEIPMDPPERPGQVSVELDRSQSVHFALSFPIGNAVDSDTPVLDVLASLLGGGESALLNSRLKYDRALVSEIYAYADTPVDPGLFVIAGETEPGHLDSAVQEVLSVLREVKRGVEADAAARARFTIEKSLIEHRETMEGKARGLATAAAFFDDPHFEAHYLAALKEIQPDDLRGAAQKHLGLERAVLAVIYPESAGESAETIQGRLRSLLEESKMETATMSLETLGNGVRLILWETSSAPTVSVSAVLRGGVRAETDRNNGVNALMARSWARGTARIDGETLTRRLEEIGSSMDGFSGMNTLGLRADSLASGFEETFGLFLDALVEPRFDHQEIANAARRMETEIRSSERDLGHQAFRRFRENLFHNHPYRLDPMGDHTRIRSISRDNLVDNYTQTVSPSNLVLSVVGAFDAVSFRQRFVPRIEGWQPAASRTDLVVQPLPVDRIDSPTLKKYQLPSHQTHIVSGFIGPPAASADRYALDVLDAALSNQSGRLFIRLRDQEALAYVVAFQSFYGIDTGYLALYLACDPSKTDQAQTGLSREISLLVENGLTPQEFEDARRYLIGSHEIGLQRNSNKSFTTALDEAMGLGYRHFAEYARAIAEVRPEDVTAVIRKYILPDRTLTVTIGGAS